MNFSSDARVSVIGAGLMGLGIAQVFAAGGHRVRLFDTNVDALDSVRARAEAIFSLLEQDPKGLDLISASDDLEEAVGGAAFVVEAGPENLALKQQVFLDLERYAPPHAVLATNTSGLSVSQVSRTLRDRTRVIATHFWNPPYLVPLVEVVQTDVTARGVVEATMELLSRVGLRPVHLNADIPGFVGNRMQHALKREAIAIVAAGVCDAETVDTVVKYGFGLRLPVLGPLEQSDLVGLELTLAIHQSLMPSLDVTAEGHPYLVQKVADGKTGAVVGEGFRKWTPEEVRALRERSTAYLVAAAKQRRRDEESRGEQGGRII